LQFRDSRVRGMAIVLTVICTGLIALLSSCETAPSPVEFDSATLQGMIYDDDHNPVQWASVSIAGADPVYTDIDGRFAVPNVERGVVTIEVGRDGFAPHTGEFLFANRTQVLYLRLHSGRYFLGRAIGALETGDNESAVQRAGQALMVIPGNPEARFVAAMASYLINDLTAAQTHLSEFSEIRRYEAVNLLRAKLAAAIADDVAADTEVE